MKKIVVKKDKSIANRLQKTEQSIVIDFASQKADWERKEIEKKKIERKIQFDNKKEEERKRREDDELK